MQMLMHLSSFSYIEFSDCCLEHPFTGFHYSTKRYKYIIKISGCLYHIYLCKTILNILQNDDVNIS